MTGPAPLAALTGGTGFLGRHVVRALVGAGWRVRLLARRDPFHPQLADLSVEVVLGDLDDVGALDRLVDGADAVIHAAGAIKARNPAQFVRVNAEGSARLAARLAATAPRARFVLVSSLAARAPELSPYAATKRAGEAHATTAASGASWVVLRPAAIYGPWDRETLVLFRLARGPIVPLFQRAGARLCLIHAEDAAAAIAALAGDGPSGVILELADDRLEGYAYTDILAAAARALGSNPRPVRLPSWTLAAAGLVSGSFARLRGRATMLTPGKVKEMLYEDWSSDPDRQPPRALWAPRIGLDEGFAATAAWYRRAGWLPD